MNKFEGKSEAIQNLFLVLLLLLFLLLNICITAALSEHYETKHIKLKTKNTGEKIRYN